MLKKFTGFCLLKVIMRISTDCREAVASVANRARLSMNPEVFGEVLPAAATATPNAGGGGRHKITETAAAVTHSSPPILQPQWLAPVEVGLVSDEQSPVVPSSDEIMLGGRSEGTHAPQATHPGQWARGPDLAKLLVVTGLALRGSVLWEPCPRPRPALATAGGVLGTVPSMRGRAAPRAPFLRAFSSLGPVVDQPCSWFLCRHHSFVA